MNIPITINAGDSLTWDDSVSEYKATEGYELLYYLRNATNMIDIESVAYGNDYRFTITPAVSLAYAPGIYKWQAVIIFEVDGIIVEKYTIDTGELTVVADLSQDTTFDRRTHAEKTLAALEAVIEGRASRSESEYEIAGRRIVHLSPGELMRWYNFYRDKVSAEQKLLTKRTSKIVTRFV